MRNSFIIFLLVVIFINQADGQNKWKKNIYKFNPVVCYASGKVEKSFVPPPHEILYQLKSSKGKTAEIIVTYEDFPEAAKTAFQYAMGIWERLIVSDIPIYLSVKWKPMGANVLANCGPSSFDMNFNGAPYLNRKYPIAVVEKIVGVEITDSSTPDIIANINQDINWYFGIDGETPGTQYDFVSTVLHEVAHGLGFSGFIYENEGLGGYYDPPAIFDEFVTDKFRKQLINTQLFDNPSEGILGVTTSNYLYFRAPVVTFDGNGLVPRLYAPSSWDNGSSVYHLNDRTYPHGNINSLMTHAGGKGEAIHDPGPLTMGILADIGWNHLWIKHDELKDLEELIEPVFIEAWIKSDFELDSTTLFVCYSTDNFITQDTLLLKATDNEFVFKAELPTDIEKGIISYYISASDKKQRTFNNPVDTPINSHKLRIGPDTISPTIIHQSNEYILSNLPELEITVFANDNIGLDSVWMEYIINDNDVIIEGLKHDTLTQYVNAIDLLQWQLKDQDSIRYRIVARDSSSNHNISYLPSEGYFEVLVEEIYDPVFKYENSFNDSKDDFISSDFEVKTAANFIDGALHSIHPYESPGDNDLFYNYTAQLKYPIVLLENGQMNYDEIVLVEPGEPDAVFGDSEFWDYVIVEGMKVGDENWLPLRDGYDSQINSNWLVEYNNGVKPSGNSSTKGRKEMFIRRNIELLGNGNFSVGDTVNIRFRLFSDPLSNGWGWVIDNLRIQTFVSVDKQIVSPGDFRIYPNPVNDKFTIDFNSERNINNINIVLYNSFGQQIMSHQINNTRSSFKNEIDMDGFKPGMYFIQAIADGQQILSRKIIKK